MPLINVEPTLTLDNLNNQFNSVYPFLRIGFFKETHEKGKANGKNKLITGDTKLNQLRKIEKIDNIDFNGKTTVWELEQSFEKKFGLHVQVFRKSGSIWLETSATDNWTLEQQNEQGKFLDEDLKFEREDPDDHDMY